MAIKPMQNLDASDVSDDQIIDASTLAMIINDCFKVARDLRYTTSQHGMFISVGIALRERLKVLVGEIFDSGSDELARANQKLGAVNAELKQTLGDINKAADTLESLGELVDQLTRLVKLAGLAP